MVSENRGARKGRNVLGGELEVCSLDPLTGWTRSGCCETGPGDVGVHCVCIVATAAFLEYSRSVGNDLSTPMPEFGFVGIKPGDRWCLCAPRWQQAFEAGMAPRVVLEATHVAALEFCDEEGMREHAVEG